MICEIANLVFFYERDFKERKFFVECDTNNNFFFLQNGRGLSLAV